MGFISNVLLLAGIYPVTTAEASCSTVYHSGWRASTNVFRGISGFNSNEVNAIGSAFNFPGLTLP